MINEQLNEFKFLSILGEGGMAKVYLAYDSKFDTNVAIKLLNKEYTHNENIRKRFLAEAKSMFRMSHPNIIKVTNLIDEGDIVAFVMEYIHGETLKEFIERKGKLSDIEIHSVFFQMIEAVGYVHEQNLVHRDIKPSNFMIDSKGKIKLMDFGIAKHIDVNSFEYTQTGTGIQMGTPLYMSPEQIRNAKEVNQATDIYSLGVVLWQMVTGKRPYDVNTLSVFDLQMKIVMENLNETNTFWDELISLSTKKRIEDRVLDCQKLKSLLFLKKEFLSEPSKHVFDDKTIVEKALSNTKYNKADSTIEDDVTIVVGNYKIGQPYEDGIIYFHDVENKNLYLCNFMFSDKFDSNFSQNSLHNDWNFPKVNDFDLLYKCKEQISEIKKDLYWTLSFDYFKNYWAYSFISGERIATSGNTKAYVLLIKKISL